MVNQLESSRSREQAEVWNWQLELWIETVHCPLAGIAGDWHISCARPGSLTWKGLDLQHSRRSGSYIVEPRRTSTVRPSRRSPKGDRDKGTELLVKETRGFTSPWGPTKSVESKENLMDASGQRGVCVGIERLAEEGSSGSEVEEDQWSNSLFFSVDLPFHVD